MRENGVGYSFTAGMHNDVMGLSYDRTLPLRILIEPASLALVLYSRSTTTFMAFVGSCCATSDGRLNMRVPTTAVLSCH